MGWNRWEWEWDINLSWGQKSGPSNRRWEQQLKECTRGRLWDGNDMGLRWDRNGMEWEWDRNRNRSRGQKSGLSNTTGNMSMGATIYEVHER